MTIYIYILFLPKLHSPRTFSTGFSRMLSVWKRKRKMTWAALELPVHLKSGLTQNTKCFIPFTASSLLNRNCICQARAGRQVRLEGQFFRGTTYRPLG